MSQACSVSFPVIGEGLQFMLYDKNLKKKISYGIACEKVLIFLCRREAGECMEKYYFSCETSMHFLLQHKCIGSFLEFLVKISRNSQENSREFHAKSMLVWRLCCMEKMKYSCRTAENYNFPASCTV